MKKVILMLLVASLAIPALAADISLVDNADGTGTIQLTVTGTEVVRGLAIVVDAGVDVTAVAGTDAIFNVFMDSIFSTPANGLGDGTPIADPAAAGEMALGAGVTEISLCMGIVDTGGSRGGAAAGTYTVATITTGAATVTIDADTLRGGIVGDDLVAGTIAGGPITVAATFCVGDTNGNGYIYTDDLTALVTYMSGFSAEYYYVDGADPRFDVKMDINQNGYIYTDDLTAMVTLLTGLAGNYYYADCP